MLNFIAKSGGFNISRTDGKISSFYDMFATITVPFYSY